MRIIAICLNLALFLVSMSLLFESYPWNLEEIIVMCIIVGCPLVNLYILTHVQEELSWLSLFLKRKTLEEKQKLKEQKQHIKSIRNGLA